MARSFKEIAAIEDSAEFMDAVARRMDEALLEQLKAKQTVSSGRHR
jgi:hypothetical protein